MQLFFSRLLGILRKGGPISLATIVNKRGSTPQIPGASAVFSESGLILGTLGGGILEGEIGKLAAKALDGGEDMMVTYSLDANIEEEQGAICGGHAEVLIDAHPGTHLHAYEAMTASLLRNTSGVLITMIEKGPGTKSRIQRRWVTQDQGGKPDLPDAFRDLEMSILPMMDDRTHVLKTSADRNRAVFYEPVCPDPQLVIVGAGHIGKALSHLGKLLDFHITVIDDRPEHANPENLPDADRIFSDDIENDLSRLRITDNTYLVIVTQGHTKDAVALQRCIHSQAAYIGMIGSKRKIRLMKEDFVAKGRAKVHELERLHAPIGIDIGSRTVQEIALSIAAELVKVRQEKNARQRGQQVELIILAAGKSERMGRQKLLLPYGEGTIIEQIVSKALASSAGRVHVVLGSHREEISRAIGKYEVNTVFNTGYEAGMLSSVQSGFRALSKDAKAGMILLGDQPMVDIKVIDRMIDYYLSGGKGIVIPVHRGHRGHPVLIDKKYLKEITQLDANVGLRQLMENHPGDVHELQVDTSSVLKDLDTIEDYNKELIQ